MSRSNRCASPSPAGRFRFEESAGIPVCAAPATAGEAPPAVDWGHPIALIRPAVRKHSPAALLRSAGNPSVAPAKRKPRLAPRPT